MGLDAYLRFRAEFVSLDPSRYPPEYIDRQVVEGRWHCWGDDRAALLTEVRTYPSGVREIHALAAAGDAKTVVGTLAPMAEHWGRENGCTRAVVESRPGWERMLPDYQLHQVALRKEL